jgi:hypothetical protein
MCQNTLPDLQQVFDEWQEYVSFEAFKEEASEEEARAAVLLKEAILKMAEWVMVTEVKKGRKHNGNI